VGGEKERERRLCCPSLITSKDKEIYAVCLLLQPEGKRAAREQKKKKGDRYVSFPRQEKRKERKRTPKRKEGYFRQSVLLAGRENHFLYLRREKGGPRDWRKKEILHFGEGILFAKQSGRDGRQSLRKTGPWCVLKRQ